MFTSLQRRRRRATSEPIECQVCTEPFAKRDRLWAHKRKFAATNCVSRCPGFSLLKDVPKQQDACSDTESTISAPELQHVEMDYPALENEQVPAELDCHSTINKLSPAVVTNEEEISDAISTTTGKDLAADESHPSLCSGNSSTNTTPNDERPENTHQPKKCTSYNGNTPSNPKRINCNMRRTQSL